MPEPKVPVALDKRERKISHGLLWGLVFYVGCVVGLVGLWFYDPATMPEWIMCLLELEEIMHGWE